MNQIKIFNETKSKNSPAGLAINNQLKFILINKYYLCVHLDSNQKHAKWTETM